MINLCRYFAIINPIPFGTGLLCDGTTTSNESKFDVCMICSNWHCDTCQHAKYKKQIAVELDAKYLESLRSDGGTWSFKFIIPDD